MKIFKALFACPLIGVVVSSCSPSSSDDSQAYLAVPKASRVGMIEEASKPYMGASRMEARTIGNSRKFMRVHTTAYSHAENEKGGIYGRKNAIGIDLKYGAIRSAAADWSRYPLGTKFRIVGQPHMYVIDDYGSALVGTDTIDIYKPNLSMMKAWGVRDLNIEILEWGSYRQSLSVLASRREKAAHCKEMYYCIKPKIGV